MGARDSMGWTRTAYYGSHAEMEAGIGRVAAAGWCVETVTPLPAGEYEVIFSQLSPTARDAAPSRGEDGRRLPFGFRIRS